MNKTTFANQQYKWFLLDAKSKTLGRLATEISRVLLGKNNVFYSPGQNIKQGLIIINAEEIIVTGNKENDKFYYRHSGTPGGLKIETFKEIKKRIPNRILEKSVKGMLPKNSLGRTLFTKLKIYQGSFHPHAAQNPITIELQ